MSKSKKKLEKEKTGRKTKFTPAVMQQIISKIKIGVAVKWAVMAAGINEATFYRRIKKDVNFASQVEIAKAEAISVYVSVVARKAISEKKAEHAQWMLAHLDPENYGERRQIVQETTATVKVDADKLEKQSLLAAAHAAGKEEALMAAELMEKIYNAQEKKSAGSGKSKP